jgi:hypothetical protein
MKLKSIHQAAKYLFQPAYYKAAYPDLDYEGLSPFEHYLQKGWREGKNPNPFLYSSWYLRTYPDAAQSGLSPLEHYYKYGAEKDYDPGPRFSTRAYRALYPEVKNLKKNPLIHYFLHGMYSGYFYTLASVGDIVMEHCKESNNTPNDFGKYLARSFISTKSKKHYQEFIDSVNSILPYLRENVSKYRHTKTRKDFADLVLDAVFNKICSREGLVHCSRPLVLNGSSVDSLATSILIVTILSFLISGNVKKQKEILNGCSDGWRRHPLVMQSAALLELFSGQIIQARYLLQNLTRMPGYMNCYDIDLMAYDHAFARGGHNEDLLNFVDLSDRICTIPFEFLYFEKGESNISCFICNSCWLPFSVNLSGKAEDCSVDRSWNSAGSREIRRSILDGDFSYCDRRWCSAILDSFNAKDKRQYGILPASVDRATNDEVGHPLSLPEIVLARRAIVPRECSKVEFFDNIIKCHLTEMEAPPISITSSIDPSCNLKCPSCRDHYIRLDKDKADGVISFYDTYIHPFITSGHRIDYSLDGSGEALASPTGIHSLEKLGRSNNKSLTLSLRTNGFLLDKSFWDNKIGEARHLIRHIRVSIDGASKETYEMLRFPSKWEVLCANMEFMGSMVASGELECLTVVFILRDENWHELLSMAELCKKWHAESFTFLRYQNKVDDDMKTYDNHDVLMPSHPYYKDALEIISKTKDFCTNNNIRFHISSLLDL